jgi:hypothetical protein
MAMTFVFLFLQVAIIVTGPGSINPYTRDSGGTRLTSRTVAVAHRFRSPSRSKGEDPAHELPRLVLVDFLHIRKHAYLANLTFPMTVFTVITRALEHKLGETILSTLLTPVPQRDVSPRGSIWKQVVGVSLCGLGPVAKVTAFGRCQLVHLGHALCGGCRLLGHDCQKYYEQAATNLIQPSLGRTTVPVWNYRGISQQRWQRRFLNVSTKNIIDHESSKCR